MKKLGLAIILLLGASLSVEHLLSKGIPMNKKPHLKQINPDEVDWKSKPLEYWKESLTPEQYRVCRLKGTEPSFSGAYDSHYEQGTYLCSNCALPLFSSRDKFNSGTGWPSFTQPLTNNVVKLTDENELLNKFIGPRVEVSCARCHAHLGHVFEDGPQPTGKRFCMNSISLLHEEK